MCISLRLSVAGKFRFDLLFQIWGWNSRAAFPCQYYKTSTLTHFIIIITTSSPQCHIATVAEASRGVYPDDEVSEDLKLQLPDFPHYAHHHYTYIVGHCISL
jgi:hypothetical protein